MNNNGRFSSLKQSIGGNREQIGYEMTFGMPREQLWHVTPPAGYIRRIMSELEFSLKLDSECGGEFSNIISRALDLLEASVKESGAITVKAANEAEELLMPLSPRAKEYALILCAHAHIDMNWQWGYDETVSATLSTFDTMLDLMDEYPEFTFSQSQTSVYQIVDEHSPEMKERILSRIREGRWEVIAGAWVETDKNMPSAASLINTVRYTREYLYKNWGIDPKDLNIDFSPDTFGHSINVPEIDEYSNLKYCYHCRGLNGDLILYKYKAPSGSELLMYREPYWYNSAITPHIGIGLPELTHRMGGLKTGLIVYGVGNHGGGATRKDVERALEMMKWPIFPSIRFGTFKEFFALADTEDIRAAIPTVDKELNFIFDGCYTTQSRIKRGNKYTEQTLKEAELMASLSNIHTGRKYNASAFEGAWQKTLFTHFHDILTGSCVQDSREYALALYQSAKAKADTELKYSLSELAKNIDTSFIKLDPEKEGFADSQSEGAGVGYGVRSFMGVPNPERGKGKTRVFNIFNTVSSEREELCELTVWDWVGDMRRISVTDENGDALEFALVDGDLMHYWDHKYFRVLVRIKIPAFGYRTVVLKEAELEKYPFYYGDTCNVLVNEDKNVLENEYIRAEFDPSTMALISLKDKQKDKELIDPSRHAGLAVTDTEVNGMSAWVIGKHLSYHPLTDVRYKHRTGNGALRCGYRFEVAYASSNVTVDVTLDKGAKNLVWNVVADWKETGGRTMPLLTLDMPLSYEVSDVLCDVPAGVISRIEHRHDIPALNYTAAMGDGVGLVMYSDCKYGYRAVDSKLSVSLINTAHIPDPYPERGIHNIRIAVGIPSDDKASAFNRADAFMRALRYVPVNPHKGAMPPSGKLMELDSENIALISLEICDNEINAVLSELSGNNSSVTLDFGKAVKDAYVSDITGVRTRECEIDGTRVNTEIAPYKIASVRVKL